jgi:pimeloyl-ACP methyl ester carboxylesterase
MTSRFWDRLVPVLDGGAVAVDLPGRNGKPGDLATLTVDDEVASVVADVESAAIDDEVVLVAHSSGGLVVPGVVAALDGRVSQVVLNAASVPPEGGCGLDCMQERHREGLMIAFEMAERDGTAITTPGRPDDPEAFRRTYGGDPLDDETLAFVVDPSRCVSDTVNHYRQPVHWSRAGDVPVTYVVNERDRPIPVDLQEEMVSRLPRPPRVIRLDTGHIPAITDPNGFATLLSSLADPSEPLELEPGAETPSQSLERLRRDER